jgi:hypothetical protein
MAKAPKTTSEHIISLYGHIKGLSREINTIKNNHLKHMHQDIDKIDAKLDKKFDNLITTILYGVGAITILFIGQVLYFLSK